MSEPILVKLKMQKKYKSILSILGLLILLISVIGLMYLFYDKVLNVSEVESNGILTTNYIDGKKFSIKNDDEIKFSVSNETDNLTYFAISFNDVKGNGSYDLKANGTTIIEGNLNTTSKMASDYISLDGKETKTYIIKIATDNEIKGTISIDIPTGTVVTFAETILNNNNLGDAKTKVGSEIANDNEGLIKTNDDLGVSYYFRGNVLNNYVSFADKLWRIVRINGDGTVRIILDNVIDELGSYYTSDDKSFAFKDVGMSTILNNWLNENLKDELKYVASTRYCSDIVKDGNTYLAYSRIITNKIPTLNCLGESFSSSIGLLSIDEVVFAGASPTQGNSSFYLYNSDIKDPWYTMSGAKGSDKEIYMFMVNSDGSLVTNIEGSLYRKVRPVISIIKNVEVAGDGTKNNPYTIIK